MSRARPGVSWLPPAEETWAPSRSPSIGGGGTQGFCGVRLAAVRFDAAGLACCVFLAVCFAAFVAVPCFLVGMPG